VAALVSGVRATAVAAVAIGIGLALLVAQDGVAGPRDPAGQVRVANDQMRPSESEAPYSRWP
jgi:hypothetical protein